MLEIKIWILLLVVIFHSFYSVVASENVKSTEVIAKDSNKKLSEAGIVLAATEKPVEKPVATTKAENPVEKPVAITKAENPVEKPVATTKAEKPTVEVKNVTHVEQQGSNEYEMAINRMNAELDVEGSVRTGFYILLALSCGALLFVGYKIYKLRLSRAERKYGVQGDRTTQELAPLPTSMDAESDEDEDQTIFDVNRREMRIF